MHCRVGENGLDSNSKKVRFVGSFPNSMERGEVNFGIWRAVRFRIRSVGAGTDIETFFDMQM